MDNKTLKYRLFALYCLLQAGLDRKFESYRFGTPCGYFVSLSSQNSSQGLQFLTQAKQIACFESTHEKIPNKGDFFMCGLDRN
jgi:hypothetical protein